jgi:ABC-type iron transport system FetAB ATPase subunit
VGVMLFSSNPKLALYTLIPAPLVVGGSLFFWRRVYPNHYRYWDSSAKQAGTLSGMLSGIRVVKAFAQEEREFDRFHGFSEYLRRSRGTVEHATASFTAIMSLIFSLGGLIVWYVGGRDVLAGHMTLGSLMAFLALLAMFYAPLATLSQLTTWLTTFLTGCHRVFELLDTPVETDEPAQAQCMPDPRGEVRFENVGFGYEPDRPVLKDVSFVVRPGDKIGIVGRSGSGKTTLVNLISRFDDVDSGGVLLDGTDVRALASRDLRRHVGVVRQEPFLFRGTICDNLLYGRADAGNEEAFAAARAAQAHDFILRTPLAYDTWLGERGAGLSGGEKQRISIARALLYDPKVLILDEATSSVDTESEKAIQMDFAPRWLLPGEADLRAGPYESLEVTLPVGSVARGVFAVRCFPATQPDDFLSLRVWDRAGQERELGIVRRLECWSPRTQELLQAALARRYFLRRITGVDDVKLERGYLLLRVQTDQGQAQFTMRWTQSQAQDYGARGKLLLDVEDNRFLVPDVEELPSRDRTLLQRYVYW